MLFEKAIILYVLIGVLAGSFIPTQIQGLDFALTALFITLTVDSIRSLKDIPSVVLAAGSFLIAMLIWPKQRLLLALLLYVGALVMRHMLAKRSEPHAPHTGEEA